MPVMRELPLYPAAVSGQLVVVLAGEDLVLDAKDVSRLVVHGEDVDVASFASDRESVAVHEQIVEHPVVLRMPGRIVDETADYAIMQSVVPVGIHEPCEHVAVTVLGARDSENVERVEPARPLAQGIQAFGVGEKPLERLRVLIDGIVPCHCQEHPPFPGKPMPRSLVSGTPSSWVSIISNRACHLTLILDFVALSGRDGVAGNAPAAMRHIEEKPAPEQTGTEPLPAEGVPGAMRPKGTPGKRQDGTIKKMGVPGA